MRRAHVLPLVAGLILVLAPIVAWRLASGEARAAVPDHAPQQIAAACEPVDPVPSEETPATTCAPSAGIARVPACGPSDAPADESQLRALCAPASGAPLASSAATPLSPVR